MAVKYISVIVALNNEENNVTVFYSRLRTVLESINKSYEIILVDDGSKDETYLKMSEIHKNDLDVNIIRLRKNIGQALSLIVALQYASGSIVVTMDGDLQHDPEDISGFLEKMVAGYAMVNGRKRKRKDNLFTKIIPSFIAKKIVSIFFKTHVQDINSTFRAYRREVFDRLIVYGEGIRFAPLLLKSDESIFEMEIDCKKREKGETHFGFWSRANRVIKDIRILYNIKIGKFEGRRFIFDDIVKTKQFHS